MNKTTKALKLTEEALKRWKEWNEWNNENVWDEDDDKALAAIREALAEPVCEHRIADARNEFVKDGYICIKCGALFRAADHAEPVQEPVAWILPVDLEVLLALKEKCGEITVYGYQRSKFATNPNDAAKPLYAAPVDTKAIGDALLFLVKRCNEQGFYSPIKQPIVQTALAAIRELK